MSSIDDSLNKFFNIYKELPIILNIGSYSVKDLSIFEKDVILVEVLTRLAAHIEIIYNHLDGYMDDDYPWPRYISKELNDIEPDDSIKRFYEGTLTEYLETINQDYEYEDWGYDFLASLYYYVFPEELEIAKNIFQENKNMKLLNDSINPNWRNKLSKLISKGRKQDALKALDKFIEDVLPLFQATPQLMEERRIAWLLRIELLRKWGRKIEALAWICLECELHPDNKTAQILRDQLMYELNLLTDDSVKQIIHNPPSDFSIDWTGVAGMQELKTLLEIDVINPIKNPELYARYKVSIPNGILLYGPPGCGKTFIARRLADKIGYDFIEVTPSTTASIYVHGTQEKIAELFTQAEKKAPCILFFDEFDAFAPNRGDNSTGYHYRSEVNEFLTHLNECHEKNILVIGATNNAKLIDPAVLRPGRLDIKIFVGPPDFEARLELLKLSMEDRPQDKIDWIRLVEYTNGHTYAEIKNIIDLAARQAAHRNVNITTDLIIEIILKNPPSISPDDIDTMRKL